MKYHTINEAKVAQIPAFPSAYFERYKAFAKTIHFGNESVVSKIEKIFAFTDMLTEFVAPYMVCKRGCSYCCHIDLLITSIEAQYIHKNLGIASHVGRSISKGHSEAKRPCPFLSDDFCCSIYAHRPFVCRVYFTLDDPVLCKDPQSMNSRWSNGIIDKLGVMLIDINGNKLVISFPMAAKPNFALNQCSTPRSHPAPAGDDGILCGSCVRLSVSSVSPSILTTCSTPLPSVAGHPIALRLGAG